jgi:hypothetical protein
MSVQAIYNPAAAADMVTQTHALLLALAADAEAGWAGGEPHTAESARQGLDDLIARHEKLPTFQIAWHLVPELDGAAAKETADKMTATLNARIKRSGSNRIPLQPRFVA